VKALTPCLQHTDALAGRAQTRLLCDKTPERITSNLVQFCSLLATFLQFVSNYFFHHAISIVYMLAVL
jgi:hypothetical protein